MTNSDERFDRIDSAIERLFQRFDEVDKRFEAVDKRFDEVDKRFDAAEKRLDGRVDGLTNYLLEMRQETAYRFTALETRLEGFLPAVAAMDIRMPPLTKSVNDLGSIFSRMAAEQSDRNAGFGDRLTRL